METSYSRRVAYRKYDYFRTGQMSNDTTCYLNAYQHSSLSTDGSRDRFFHMTRQSYGFKHGGHTYMLRIGLDPNSDDESHAYVRYIGVLVDPNKNGVMTDGCCYETTPQDIEPVAINEGRTLRYLVRCHGGTLPEYMDNCIRIVAGFANYIQDNSYDFRRGILIDFLLSQRCLPGIASGELLRSFIEDPIHPVEYAGLSAWKTAETAAEAAERVRERIRKETLERESMSTCKDMLSIVLEGLASSDVNQETSLDKLACPDLHTELSSGVIAPGDNLAGANSMGNMELPGHIVVGQLALASSGIEQSTPKDTGQPESHSVPMIRTRHGNPKGSPKLPLSQGRIADWKIAINKAFDKGALYSHSIRMVDVPPPEGVGTFGNRTYFQVSIDCDSMLMVETSLYAKLKEGSFGSIFPILEDHEKLDILTFDFKALCFEDTRDFLEVWDHDRRVP